MAASDPNTDVPTPTGTLQGVAAFSWDGSAWQPSGRAGPAVATPTGVLQGVAPFSWSGSAWTPAGRAQPGIATPSGVLDGVAVYTWSGSAWVPASGTATPSTSTGALRGVAAFSWDGAAWQPAGRAGPSVATPYGVLAGVAMFNWSGTTWAAGAAVPAGATLDLSFLSAGTLDPRITFTRASTGTCFNSAGVMQTVAANAPRWDYNPSTLALNGLLLEEQRTNLVIFSADASNAAWAKVGGGAAAPTVTGNQVIAPDGSTTASRIVYPAVSGAGNFSYIAVVNPTFAAANPYSFSIWLRGSVGGEQLYLCTTPDGATYYRSLVTLTTGWQRYILATPSLTAVGWYFILGTDLRDASQTAKSAQTIYAWGGQVEQGAFPTSYIPTAAATVTRAIDSCIIPPANMGWFVAPGGSWQAEYFAFGAGSRIIGYTTTGQLTPLYVTNLGQVAQYDGGGAANTINGSPFNEIDKGATNYVSGTGKVCLNGGAVASAAISTGYGLLNTGGFGFLTAAGTGSADNTSGYIRRVRYWPRVLSDAELQVVTT